MRSSEHPEKGPVTEAMRWVSDALVLLCLSSGVLQKSCCCCASVLCYKVRARECHASLAHVLATTEWPLWSYDASLLQYVFNFMWTLLARSRCLGAKAHIEDVCHDAIIMAFLDIFFPLSLPESLSPKGPSALLLPAFNHRVVVPDEYLIPFKIPLIMHLLATCLQRFPSKPQPWGEHWDLLDYFSAREWKQRWLLIVFFLLLLACPSFIMTVVYIPSWPLCDLAWLHTWDLWSHETKKLQVLPWIWWPFVHVCACEHVFL